MKLHLYRVGIEQLLSGASQVRSLLGHGRKRSLETAVYFDIFYELQFVGILDRPQYIAGNPVKSDV